MNKITPANTASKTVTKMTPEPIGPEPHLSADQQSFEKLPDKTRDLQILGDRAEKETGKKRAALDLLIKIRSDQK